MPFKHDYFYIKDWFTFYIYYPGGGSLWIEWHTDTIFWTKRIEVWKGVNGRVWNCERLAWCLVRDNDS